MKLQGLALVLPVLDLRPFVEPEARLPWLSKLWEIKPGKTFIRGFGQAQERRKLHIPWRASDTVFFECDQAIQYPRHLPDGAPVTFFVRRIFLDGRSLARFEFAIFTHPDRRSLSRGHYRLDEFAHMFWELPVRITRQGVSTNMPLGAASLELVDHFAKATSKREMARPDLCRALSPQLQVIVEASHEELGREAYPLDGEGKTWLVVQTLPMAGRANPVDTVYLAHLPGVGFNQRRMLRAHVAGLHGDLEILVEMLLEGISGTLPEPFLMPASEYLVELARGIRAGQAPADSERRLVSTVYTALKKFYAGRFARLMPGLKESRLPNKEKLAELIERDAPHDRQGEISVSENFRENFLRDPFTHSPMLLYYSQRMKNDAALKGCTLLCLLHFLRDLVPFVLSLKNLGLPLERAHFYYKEYPYPQKEAIAKWLSHTCGSQVHSLLSLNEDLARLAAEQSVAKRDLLVLEDGGHIYPAILQRHPALTDRLCGVVEQTTRGHDNIQGALSQLVLQPPIPVLSPAKSTLKREFEPPHIARAFLANLRTLEPDINRSLSRVALIAYGAIGKAIADKLRQAENAHVTIFDTAHDRLLDARQHGFAIVNSAKDACTNAELVIGCSGKTSIGRAELLNLQNGTSICSASSEQYEIDLEELKAISKNHRPAAFGSEHDLVNGRTIKLLANGYPLNFWGMESMPNEASDLVLCLLFLAITHIASNWASLPCGLDTTKVDKLGTQFGVARLYLELHSR